MRYGNWHFAGACFLTLTLAFTAQSSAQEYGYVSDDHVSEGYVSDGYVSDGHLSEGYVSEGEGYVGDCGDGSCANGSCSTGACGDGSCGNGYCGNGACGNGYPGGRYGHCRFGSCASKRNYWYLPYTEQSQPDVFYNFYVPNSYGSPAAAYPAPYPTPNLVGHTYVTYQPLMPHEWLYKHHRSYHQYYNGGMGMNRTIVKWQGTPILTTVKGVRNVFRLPR